MEWVRLIVAVVITCVWLVLYLRSFIDSGFTAPPEVSGIMLAVVTWLFGAPIKDRMVHKVKKKAKEIASEDEA